MKGIHFTKAETELIDAYCARYLKSKAPYGSQKALQDELEKVSGIKRNYNVIGDKIHSTIKRMQLDIASSYDTVIVGTCTSWHSGKYITLGLMESVARKFKCSTGTIEKHIKSGEPIDGWVLDYSVFD